MSLLKKCIARMGKVETCSVCGKTCDAFVTEYCGGGKRTVCFECRKAAAKRAAPQTRTKTIPRPERRPPLLNIPKGGRA